MRASRFRVVLLTVACGGSIASAAELSASTRAPPKAQKTAPARPRYVSSQAYYHALKAELAFANQDLASAASELQLALVYDSDSAYLTLELAWVRLKLGSLPKAEKLADRALVLDPGSGEAWVVKSRAQLGRGETQAAERSLKRALDLDPQSIDTAIELARLFSKNGRVNDALQLLSRTAERSPRSPEPLAEIARIEVDRSRLSAASQALETALSRDPHNLPIAAALVSIYERQARWEDAVARWREVVELAPGDVDALFGAARAELWVGRDEQADRYVETIQSMHRGPEIDQQIGLLYASEGRFDRAVSFLSEVVRAAPSDPRLRFAYASALEQIGNREAALAELELIGPEHELYVEARVRIGGILLELGRFDRARLAIRSALERMPRSAPLIVFHATLLERSGQPEDALKALRAARKSAQEERNVAADLELADAESALLVRSGDRDRGIRLLRSVVEGQGAIDESALYRLGACYERAGDLDAAVDTMQKLLHDFPESSRALNFVGFTWADRSIRTKESEKLLKHALVLEPRSGAIIDSLGWLHFRQGKLDRAEQLLRRAARLLPSDPEVLEHLGDVLSAREEKAPSVEAYRQSIAVLEREALARAPNAQKSLARLQKKLSDLTTRARATR